MTNEERDHEIKFHYRELSRLKHEMDDHHRAIDNLRWECEHTGTKSTREAQFSRVLVTVCDVCNKELGLHPSERD